MEIKDMTAVQLSAAIKEGKITVSDAVEASLAAVRASEASIHAFLLVDEEGARARAAEVQKKIDAGELTGPLAGVPPAVPAQPLQQEKYRWHLAPIPADRSVSRVPSAA